MQANDLQTLNNLADLEDEDDEELCLESNSKTQNVNKSKKETLKS